MPDFPPRYVRKDSVEGEGTLVADGTEQVILDVNRPNPFRGVLYLDVNNLAGIDIIDLTEYVQTSATAALRKFTVTRFTGQQEIPMITMIDKAIGYRHRLTLKQVQGTYRSFPWQYILEELVNA